MSQKYNHDAETKVSETESYNEAVENRETPATEPKVPFWQSAKFQWTIIGIGVIIVLGIAAWKWLAPAPTPFPVDPNKSKVEFQIDGKTFTPADGEVKFTR